MGYNPHHDRGETYAELIAYAEQGHPVSAERLARAKDREEQQAEKQAEQQKIADDLAAAKQKFNDDRATKDAEHLPILADMIEELQESHQDLVDAYPVFQAAQRAYAQVKAARRAKWEAIRDYVGTHYGHRDFMVDTTTGKLHYTTYQGSMGAVIVNGEQVHENGSTTPQ